MKICWDNLEKFSYKNGYLIHVKTKKKWIFNENVCKVCGEEFISQKRRDKVSEFCCRSCQFSYLNKGKKNPMYGKSSPNKGKKIHTEKSKEKLQQQRIGKKNPFYGKNHSEKTRKGLSKTGKENPNWKGGVSDKKSVLYDTYASKINWIEKVRRNKDDSSILEVKCAYCGKWFIPTYNQILYRTSSLNNNGDGRLYCSEECKKSCPIYRQKLHPKDFKIGTSREVQPELRQMVFERDDWTCQKCKQKGGILHCHHVEGILWEPIESADMDKCITLCKNCHKSIHKQDGCKYSDLQCK